MMRSSLRTVLEKSRKERTSIRLTRQARLPKWRQSNLKGLSDNGKAPKKTRLDEIEGLIALVNEANRESNI